MAEVFADSNVLLYLLSADERKADRAQAVLQEQCVVSVQVLNEAAHVARKKAGMSWEEIDGFLALIRALCTVVPLTIETHNLGRRIAAQYRIGLYNALIVASSILSGCRILYSEDLQHGMIFDEKVELINPFPGIR
ncbi:MAG: PIN domain-containing protein [Betaproteobacteria bacterium]|nr:PIN domain-containing protein [Betaproteobacteria bacterium]